MSLSLYEQETIINYNQEERTATIFTYSKSLVTRLEKLRKRLPDEVALLREEKTGAREYRVPKSCIDIKIPRDLSPAERERLKRQGKKAYATRLRKQAESTAENAPIGEDNNSK